MTGVSAHSHAQPPCSAIASIISTSSQCLPNQTMLAEAEHIILIVDDQAINLNVLNDLLKDKYLVRAATSGTRALQIAHSEPRPDLILLDVLMPDISGFTVLQRLKDDPATRDIPVIIVTSLQEVEDEQFGFDLGAVDYITKPVRPAIVLARVAVHLELADARRRLNAIQP
jgi:putative two-component system response regulator